MCKRYITVGNKYNSADEPSGDTTGTEIKSCETYPFFRHKNIEVGI